MLAIQWVGSHNNVEWYLVNRSPGTWSLDDQNHWKPVYSIYVPVKDTQWKGHTIALRNSAKLPLTLFFLAFPKFIYPYLFIHLFIQIYLSIFMQYV